MYVCIFIKLHITAQSGPVILVILCHSHVCMYTCIRYVCMYVCMYYIYSCIMHLCMYGVFIKLYIITVHHVGMKMYACMYHTYTHSNSKDQPGMYEGCQSCRGPEQGKLMFISLPPLTPENLVSRDGFGSHPSRVSLLISTLRLNLVLTYGIPPEFRGGVHLFI